MGWKITRNLDLASLVSALLAFTAYVLLSLWILREGHLHEDAYILFTYAEHLAAGDGIVYFAGGEPTEGATAFLWMIILAFLALLGVDTGISAAILNGIGIGLIAYILTLNLGWKQQSTSTFVAGALFAALLVNSEIAAAGASGFSTAFYVSIAVVIFHLYLNARASTLTILPWISLLLGLIRPDGVIIGVLASLAGLEQVWRTNHRAAYFYNMIAAGLLGLVYFAWRFDYFGHLLPLPLYVKSHDEARLPGLSVNLDYLRDQAVLLSIAGLALTQAGDIKRFVLAIAPFAALLVGLAFAHQSQNVAYRFQAPVTGALLLSFALFLGTYLKSAISWKKILGAIVVFPVVASSTGVDTGLYRYLTNSDYINYFPFLARDMLHRDVTVALTEAGRLAYWTDAKTYDLTGLNNSHVATKRLDPAYLERLDPDVIFIHTAGTLESFSRYQGNTVRVFVDFIDRQLKRNAAWEKIDNPVNRAPYVVYEYLKKYPGKHDLVFARYGGEFSHLYAVKRGGAVDWTAFIETLERSFDNRSRMSYLDMKRLMN